MLALASAVLADIRVALAPVECDIYRPEMMGIPSCWVRPPSSTAGPFGPFSELRSGLLTVDLWGYSWAEVEEMEGKLAWLEGHTVSAAGYVILCYRLESSVPVFEDYPHKVLTYSTGYMRGGA